MAPLDVADVDDVEEDLEGKERTRTVRTRGRKSEKREREEERENRIRYEGRRIQDGAYHIPRRAAPSSAVDYNYDLEYGEGTARKGWSEQDV